MAIVYVHKKKIDDSIFYVGIGKRMYRAKDLKSRNKHWRNTTSKHEWYYEYIETDVDYETAKELEMFLIDVIGIDNLTNITLGGEGTLGVKHSDEHIKKCVEARAGYRHSDETKNKISASNKGNVFSCDIINKFRYCKKNSRAVVMSLNGLDLKIFRTVRDAERFIGVKYSNIGNVCNGKRLTSNGYNWRWI